MAAMNKHDTLSHTSDHTPHVNRYFDFSWSICGNIIFYFYMICSTSYFISIIIYPNLFIGRRLTTRDLNKIDGALQAGDIISLIFMMKTIFALR